MSGGNTLLVLFSLLFLFILFPPAQGIDINACGTYSSYVNELLVIQKSLKVGLGTCLLFTTLQNVTIRGNGESYNFTSASGTTGYAIEIAQANNVTISDVNVQGVAGMKITASGNVTVMDSTFNNPGGSQYGLELHGTNTFAITRNAFYGYLDAIYSDDPSVDIQGNTFANQIVSAIALTRSAFANIISNQVYGIGQTGFAITATRAFVAGNFLSGGLNVYAGIQMQWINEGLPRTITNNIVESVTVESASAAVAFMSLSSSASLVTFSNNIVRNVTNKDCNACYGFMISETDNFLLINNTVSDIHSAPNSCYGSAQYQVAPYYISSSVGDFKNNKAFEISGFSSSLRAASTEPQLSAIRILNSSLTISDCYFRDFTGANFPDCSDSVCNATNAASTAGILVNSSSPTPISSVNMTNTLFENFQGGNGGSFAVAQATNNLNGGNVYGVYYGSGSTINVSDSEFRNFTGGKAGTLNGEATGVCLDGIERLYSGSYPPPVFYNVTGLSTITTCKSSITSCLGQISNIANAELSLNIPEGFGDSSCISFYFCTNVTVRGNGLANNLSITISQSTTFTVSSITFSNTQMKIVESQYVTIQGCAFSNSKVQAQQSENIYVSNSLFSGQSGVNMSNVLTQIVGNNQFINTTNTPIRLSSADEFVIANNTILDNVGQSTIFVTASNGYGAVSFNKIVGGTMEYGIYLAISNGFGQVTVYGNLVSGFSATCRSNVNVYGISVSNNITFPPLEISNNRVENIAAGCPHNMHGISLSGFNITSMDNNTVSNISSNVPDLTDPAPVGAIYTGITIGITSNSTLVTNTTISNIHIGTVGSYPYTILAGMSLYSSNMIINGLIIEKISVGNTVVYAPQMDGYGQNVVGLASNVGFLGTNIHMSDLKAGNGANFPNTTYGGYYSTVGGSAIGIRVAQPNNENNVIVHNATFINLIAGSGGIYDKQNGTVFGACLGGYATYYLNVATTAQPGMQYFSELEAFYMLDGIACTEDHTVLPPPNATVTYNRTSYTISWSPSSSASTSPLLYSVDQFGASNLFYTIYNGSSLSFTNKNLTFNTTYWVRLYSVHNNSTSGYVNFVITTKSLSKPSKPIMSYKEFSRTSVSLSWNVDDDGGVPVQSFVLRVQNYDAWDTKYNGSQNSYTVSNLTQAGTYHFQVAAVNKFGQSDWSDPLEFLPPTDICGDGTCAQALGETCNSCSLDCGSCGYQPCPGTPQCNGGTCASGVCICPSSKSGPACEYTSIPIAVKVNDTAPGSTVSIGDQGESKSTDYSSFTVSFRDIQEVDPNGKIVKSFDLQQQKFFVSAGTSSPSYNETIFNTTLDNHAIVVFYIYVVSQDSTFQFANQSISAPANSIKYSVAIFSWPFDAYANKLKVIIESQGTSQKNKKDDCLDISSRNDDSANLLWVRINLNGAVLYGRFPDVAEVDGAQKTVQFSYDQAASLVAVTVPHFWDSAVFDPNFQVLLDSNHKAGCSTKKSLTSGKIAGIVVGVVFGVAILAALIGYIIFKTRRARAVKRLRGADSAGTSLKPLRS